MWQIIFTCLVAVSLAAPKPQDDVTVLRDERVDQGDGNFNYAFELSDGTAVEAVGSPGEGGAVNIRGSYTYILSDGDGSVYKVTYVADEAGFRVEQGLALSVVFYSDDVDAEDTDLR